MEFSKDFLILFGSELFGSFLIIFLGNGISWNINLKTTYGSQPAVGGGFVGGCIGWGIAVMVGATVASIIGGPAHLNPAVTIAMVASGNMDGHYADLLPILIGSGLGFFIGQLLIDLFYVKFVNDVSVDVILSCHVTIPKIRKSWYNLLVEVLATFILVTVVLSTSLWFVLGWNGADATNQLSFKFMGPIFTGLTIIVIGFALGGPTGYAINPFRDLMPRIVHQILPIKGKGKSDWEYSWIPVVGPLLGGTITGLLFLAINEGVQIFA